MIRAAGFIIYRMGEYSKIPEFLMLESSRGKNHWTPPKGHIERREDEMTAAIRELHEETGLRLHEIELDRNFTHKIEYNTPKGPKECTYFLGKVEINCEIILSDEHLSYKWFRIEDMNPSMVYQDYQKLMQFVYDYISKLK